MAKCFIGVGSNLGDRLYYINTAVKKIKMLSLTKVTKLSSIIENLPCGGPAQGPYLNAVLAIDTELIPYELLQKLQEIETALGRIRIIKNSPRTIDLDILIYGDVCINEDALCIPHPRMLDRDFVISPLKEIAPDLVKKLLLKDKKSKFDSNKKRLVLKIRKNLKKP